MSPFRGQTAGEAETLGEIVAEVIDRIRDGQEPRPEEYVARHPHLREEIQAHFETISLLEGRPAAAGAAGAVATGTVPTPLVEVLAALPPRLQRLIFLRNFEKRRWEEIARLLGEPEMELRRSYARVIHELLSRGSGET
jgi:DNA-directed RNA polymerase specialized sigma24 family protein